MGELEDFKDPELHTQIQRDPVSFARLVLGLKLAETQRKILRSVRNNRRTLVISGNGVGKSYAVAGSIAWWINTRPDSVSLLTSGSYTQMEDTTWRPLKVMMKVAQERYPIAQHARLLDSKPPSIEFPADEWYFKGVSPRNPDGLEGRHNQECLVVIEEADKEAVDDQVFESAASSVTDSGDRMVAVANPPKDETNVVYHKMKSDRWNVVRFSSFESHNVLIDSGELDDDPIPGLVALPIIAEDWEDWNDRSWPGFDGSVSAAQDMVDRGEMERQELVRRLRPGLETVRTAHEEMDDLAVKWYRRRGGVMPSSGAEAHRPFSTADVKRALRRPAPSDKGALFGVGIDLARKGGDSTVYTEIYAHGVDEEEWSGVDHNENESRLRELLAGCPGSPPSAADAVGEGSGVADSLNREFGTLRFKAGTKPRDPDMQDEYENMWTEGLHHLSGYLDHICLSDISDKLEEQLLVASRVIEYEEVQRKSGDVLRAAPKEQLKEALGYSPDRFDALVEAAWASEQETSSTGRASFYT